MIPVLLTCVAGDSFWQLITRSYARRPGGSPLCCPPVITDPPGPSRLSGPV